ncbi:unnamed protein product, partial [Mesorhabditis spiculigera]
MAYLDYAGSGIPSPALLETVAEQIKTINLANPHSRHSTSQSTYQIVEETRLSILEYFNTEDYEVIFTANATRSLQIVAENFVFGEKTKLCNSIDTILPETGPAFCYMNDAHNSVMGMREIVKNRVDSVACLKFDSIVWDSIQPIQNSLLMYTAMSNFSGRQYPLENVEKLQSKGWSVCIDSAALISSSSLDLSKIQPHFLVASFYKIFGYPTGIGCLLVHKVARMKLKKQHFAGGTLAMADPFSFISHQKEELSERFEDGTINYYAIAALREAFVELEKWGTINRVKANACSLTKNALEMLRSRFHWNGKPLVKVYGHDSVYYGPIIAFNLLRDDGSFIGYNEAEKMCSLFGVQLRTGCFCNIGACMEHLGITPDELHLNFLSGKKCGDEMDTHNGKPLGAVRISFGRFSKQEDIDLLEKVLECCFLGTTSILKSNPSSHSIADFRPKISKIYYYPIKSARGIRARQAELSPSGFTYDRRFLVQSLGVTLTQKKNPEMCLLKTEIVKNQLNVHSGDENFYDSLQVPLEATDIKRKTIICEDSVGTYDCGDKAGKWLTKTLRIPNCRLLRAECDTQRSLSNESPFLFINEASVQILAEQIALTREELILRFRPNIVVRGLPAFMEDEIERISIGEAEFEVTGKCTRCEMICVDPETGIKDPALIVALRNYRNRQKMTFGIYLRQTNYEDGSKICENEPVTCFGGK